MKFRILLPVLFFYSSVSYAQLCNNNLGDPIVNVTFGSGQNFPPNKTSYNYVHGCPSKGEYTIADFLFGCGGYWVQMTGDHTGDPKGNYMLIDAESSPGIVHLDTAKNLCGNMTYQYSAFITNVMQDKLTCGSSVVLPNLDFNIEKLDGTIIATYNTGDIPITNIKLWKQYGFTFKTPANVNEVILKIISNSKPGCGSAFAIDDIVFQNCGPVVNVAIDGTTADQNVCADYTNPFVMQGTYSAGFTDPVVQWQNSLDTGKTWKDIPGQNTTTYTVPRRTSGVIEYRMIVAERANINSLNCRIRSNAIYTEIHPLPTHNPPQYVNGCSGRDFTLPPSDPHALAIQWNGPNNYTYSTADPPAIISNLQYADTGLYKLKETFYFGCITIDSFYLKVSPGITVSTQPSSPICEGQSENLSATTSVAGSFKWTPAQGLSNDTIADPVASPQDSTVYKVVVTNTSGCQDSAFLPIDVYKKPVANAGEDKTILSGDSAVLSGSLKGTAINYYWSPPSYMNDVNAIQPKVYPLQDMVYTLTATSTVGCGSSADNVNVTVYKGFFIPNAFTPNGDGKNDRFKILSYDNYKVEKFIIYNRWGTAIFKSSKADEGWDGTYNNLPQPIGSYIYYIELLDPNNNKLIKEGTVSLLR